MKTRLFGKTGITIGEIGLGTWQLGPDWGGVDDATAQGILRASAEGGVNFFDTADIYGAGLSEERIGQFLKDSKNKVFVATKLGRFNPPGWPKNYSLQNFRLHTENSLKRLGVEALDLTQVHCIDPEYLKGGEWVEWLSILKKEGKVRNFGASVQNMDEAVYCLDHFDIASLQIIFNIFRQTPAEVFFEKAKAKKMALIVRLALASGLLSGKITADRSFAPEDHRFYNRDGQAFNVGETFSGLPLAKGAALVQELKPWVPAGMTMAQMALRWVLDFNAVSVIIPGATKIEQVRENVKVSDLPSLSKDLHQRLHDFYQAKVASAIRGKY